LATRPREIIDSAPAPEQLLQRGKAFFDDSISVFNLPLLLDNDKFSSEFNTRVVMDLETPVDDVVKEVSELISQRARIQARSVIEFVGTRPRTVSKSMIGNVSSFDAEFDRVRYELIDKRFGTLIVIKKLSIEALNVYKVYDLPIFLRNSAILA